MHADLPVRVTPRSSQSKWRLDSNGSLNVWVMASPTDGQANEAVCALVAKALSLGKSRVSVLRGQTGRQKVLRIEGLDLDACMERLRKAAE